MIPSYISLRKIVAGEVTLNTEQELTNKTLNDYTNLIHADATHIRVKATEEILKGGPVSFRGDKPGEDAIEVVKTDNTTMVSMGIAHENLNIGEFGLVISNGLLEGVDTNDYTEGQILYTDSDGLLTPDEPTVGIAQPIAFVLRKQSENGAIMINASYPKQDADDIRYNATATLKEFIESNLITAGSGTNSTWTKFPDGTIIETVIVDLPSFIAKGSIYGTDAETEVSPTQTFISLSSVHGASDYSSTISVNATRKAGQKANVRAYTYYQLATSEAVTVTFIGRWK